MLTASPYLALSLNLLISTRACLPRRHLLLFLLSHNSGFWRGAVAVVAAGRGRAWRDGVAAAAVTRHCPAAATAAATAHVRVSAVPGCPPSLHSARDFMSE